MNTDTMFSSGASDWRTPPDLFQWLNDRFNFNIDLAADKQSTLLPEYFSPEQDSLKQDWQGKRGFLNPPYGRRVIDAWTEKAVISIVNAATLIVALLPARTDTRWFQNNVLKLASIYWIAGRLRFLTSSGQLLSSAPFPSIIAVWGSDDCRKQYTLNPKKNFALIEI